MHAPQIPAADVLLQRITIDPNICHGKPCIRGRRYPVETFLELLSAGMTIEEILADYEDLERADILVDAHLPRRLAHRLRAWGHEAIHTLDFPRGNRTPDEEAAGAIALP